MVAEPRLATELEFECSPFWPLFFVHISGTVLLCSAMHIHELVEVEASIEAGFEDLGQVIVQVSGAENPEEIAVIRCCMAACALVLLGEDGDWSLIGANPGYAGHCFTNELVHVSVAAVCLVAATATVVVGAGL